MLVVVLTEEFPSLGISWWWRLGISAIGVIIVGILILCSRSKEKPPATDGPIVVPRQFPEEIPQIEQDLKTGQQSKGGYWATGRGDSQGYKVFHPADLPPGQAVADRLRSLADGPWFNPEGKKKKD